MFKDVVLLNEQMRQQHDTAYHELLQRARNATIIQADIDLLNIRVVTDLESHPDQINTCIVRTNKFRYLINYLQIERFAPSQDQKIFIFPAHHAHWRKPKGMHNVEVDKLFEVQDGSNIKGPGLLMYTQNILTAVLSNISTPLDIINGAQARAIRIVPDPNNIYIPYITT